MRTRVLLIGALALAPSCAKKARPIPPKPHWVAPDYAEHLFGEGTLTVAPDGELRVISAFDVKTRYAALIKKDLARFVRTFSNFGAATLPPGVPSTMFEARTLEIDEKTKITLHLPSAGGTARFGDWMTRFVLFIGPIELQDPQRDVASPHDEGAWIQQRMAYAFWDNKKGRLAAYGQVEAVQPFCDPDRIMFCSPDDLSEEEMEFLVAGMFSEVFRDTPFEKSRRYLKSPKRGPVATPLPPPVLTSTAAATSTSTTPQ